MGGTFQLNHRVGELHSVNSRGNSIVQPGVILIGSCLPDQITSSYGGVIHGRCERCPRFTPQRVTPLAILGPGLATRSVQGCAVGGLGLCYPHLGGSLRLRPTHFSPKLGRAYGCFGLSAPNQNGGRYAYEGHESRCDGTYALKIHGRP